MNIPIKKGKQSRAQRLVIYGPEGIGKSTLAAEAPAPLFLDTEMGTGQLDVDRVEVQALEHISLSVQALINEPHEYKTVVLDTADNLWRLCADAVVASNKSWNDIEGPGFGKGYAMAADKFRMTLGLFDQLIARGINVVVVSHAKVSIVSPPDTAEYSKYCIKVAAPNKQAEASRELLKEWCDCLLFCNFDTVVDSDKGKARKHTRVVYTTCAPAWEAKNRYGLPEKMDMTAETMAEIFAMAAPAAQVGTSQHKSAEVSPIAPPQQPTPAEAVPLFDEEILVAYFVGIGKLQHGETLEQLPPNIAAALKARPERALAKAQEWLAANGGAQ